MFISLFYQFHNVNYVLGPEYGRYVHAAFIKDLFVVNAELGNSVHSNHEHKGFTLSLVSDQMRTHGIKLTLFGSEGMRIYEILPQIFKPSSFIKIGNKIIEVEGVNFNMPPWTGFATWSDILGDGRLGKMMDFQFISPTAITKSYHGHRYIQTQAIPRDVFQHLLDRWLSLNGPRLPKGLLNFVEKGGCITADQKISTVEFLTDSRIQKAFIGKVTYLCIDENVQEFIHALNALTRLSYYTSIGYHTTQCMGHVLPSVSGWMK